MKGGIEALYVGLDYVAPSCRLIVCATSYPSRASVRQFNIINLADELVNERHQGEASC